jgi:hypothetical protein
VENRWPERREFGDLNFDNVAGNGRSLLCPHVILSDLRGVEIACLRIRRVANMRITFKPTGNYDWRVEFLQPWLASSHHTPEADTA